MLKEFMNLEKEIQRELGFFYMDFDG